ncbi:MAG: CAF17-like 4Fe-4S cluster assembly/insertion protein YgfZ [bacterium]
MSDDATSGSKSCHLSHLDHLGWIKVSGEDARTLLQGQLTNDINLVTPQQAQFSALCNPKGRMFSNFLIFEQDEALYLQLQASILEPVLKRLSMFVLMSKVEITDASPELASVGLSGTDCITNENPDDQPLSCTASDDLVFLRPPGEEPRIQIVGPKEAIQSWLDANASRFEEADADLWPLLDIRAGVPSIHAETMESFVPQMTNLPELGGVSFTKGCFTGQEVVARMHYLGKVKRRMYHAKFQSDTVPLPGHEVFSASSKSGQGDGNIVDARATPDGSIEALLVTQTTSFDANDLTLTQDGPAIEVSLPPYPFEEKDTA